MKIRKYVEFADEIQIDISAEEIRDALLEDPENKNTVMIALNRISQFLKAVPDSIVDQFNDYQRVLIRNAFNDFARRF